MFRYGVSVNSMVEQFTSGSSGVGDRLARMRGLDFGGDWSLSAGGSRSPGRERNNGFCGRGGGS